MIVYRIDKDSMPKVRMPDAPGARDRNERETLGASSDLIGVAILLPGTWEDMSRRHFATFVTVSTNFRIPDELDDTSHDEAD